MSKIEEINKGKFCKLEEKYPDICNSKILEKLNNLYFYSVKFGFGDGKDIKSTIDAFLKKNNMTYDDLLNEEKEKFIYTPPDFTSVKILLSVMAVVLTDTEPKLFLPSNNFCISANITKYELALIDEMFDFYIEDYIDKLNVFFEYYIREEKLGNFRKTTNIDFNIDWAEFINKNKLIKK